MYSYAVYFSGIRQEDSLKSALLAEIYNFLTKESEANTIYTLLVAAGTMVCNGHLFVILIIRLSKMSNAKRKLWS